MVHSGPSKAQRHPAAGPGCQLHAFRTKQAQARAKSARGDFFYLTVPASQTDPFGVLLDAEPSSRETLMPAWVSVLQYVYQHGKWVVGSSCRPGLISARATGDVRAGSVLAQAGADLGRAATAPVGLPRRCRCTDSSTWVGWARVTPRLGGAAPFTGMPRPTGGARKSKMGPKTAFLGVSGAELGRVVAIRGILDTFWDP